MKHVLISIIALATLISCGGAEERKEVYLEKARFSLDVGDLDKARVELKNVLQIDPKDAGAYFQLGEIYDAMAEYQKAFVNYSKAVELAPDNLEYHAKIGSYLLILSGDIDRALEERDLILGKDGTNIHGLLLKASILFKQNDVTSAKKISQEIFSRHPEFVRNAMFLSSLYLIDKKYDDSTNVLNACIKGNPQNRSLASALANAYLTAGEYDQAEIEYRKILNKNREVFLNHVKLATFYKKIGSLDKAEEVLRNAVNENTDDAQRKIALVEFIQHNKGEQSAIEELRNLISTNKNMGELRLSLAALYLRVKNLEDAEMVLKKTVLDFSEDSVGIKSRVYLASLYMQKQNIEAATSVIDDALKISPNDFEVNFAKAKLQLTNKDYGGAIISLRIVIKDDPQNIDAYFLLSEAHRGNGEEKQAGEIINRAYERNRSNAKALMALARYHARNKNNVELEKVIDNCLSINANDYEALSFKTKLLNGRKQFSEAKPYALRMVELYPHMPDGYVQSVPYVLIESGKIGAISLLEDAYKKVNEKNSVLELLVSFQASTKGFDNAISTVQSAIRENAESAELYILLAKVQIASAHVDAAKASLNKAMNIKPDWNEPYLRLAKIYTDAKQSRKAIEVLQQGMAELKTDLSLSLELSKIYETLGDYNAAINEYEKAYEKYADNGIVMNNLAILLAEHRNDENSLKRAKELADKLKNVDSAVTLDTVGWVYYKAGDYAGAVAVLKTVVEKSPNVAVFNYHLGMALYKTGDEAAARNYLMSALANNSIFSGKTEAEAQLKKLQ